MSQYAELQANMKKLVAKQSLDAFMKQIATWEQAYGVTQVFNSGCYELLNRHFNFVASRQFCQAGILYMLRQHLNEMACLECFADLLGKLSQVIPVNQMGAFVEELSQQEPALRQVLNLLANTQLAPQIVVQLQRSASPAEQRALAVYQRVQMQKQRPLPQPTNVCLQRLLKYGYTASLYEPFLRAILKDGRPGTQFTSELVVFLTQTYSHALVARYQAATIAQSLGVDFQPPQKEILPESWDIAMIFKTYQSMFGPVRLVDSLRHVSLPQASPVNPNFLIYTLFIAQFGLSEPKCYCSECSFRQQEFCLIDQICSDRFEIQPLVRVSLLAGVVHLCAAVSEQLSHQLQDLRGFQNTPVQPEPRQFEQLFQAQRYAYYLNFSRTRCTPWGNGAQQQPIKDPLQTLLDGFAAQWKRYGLNMQRTCAPEPRELDGADILQTNAYLWRSIDFVRQLVKLQAEFPLALQILGGQRDEAGKQANSPLERCSEQLAYTLSYLDTSDNFVKAVSALCLYRYFNKQVRSKQNTPIIEQICKAHPELLDFTLQAIWAGQPQLAGKLLDTAQEQKCLQLCVKSSQSMYFSLDMATLAAGRQLINLQLYLNGQFMQAGPVFAEACCVFLLKKLLKFKRQTDASFEQSPVFRRAVKLVGEEFQQCVSQPSVQENVRLAAQRPRNVAFEEDFSLIQLSDAVVSESLISCYYRLLVFYAGYFDLAVPGTTKLGARLATLFQLATEMCLTAFPRLQLTYCADVSNASPEAKQRAKRNFLQLATEVKSRTQFAQELDAAFKGQEQQERFYYLCSLNYLVQFVTTGRVPGAQKGAAPKEVEVDGKKVDAHQARILAATMTGTLLAEGLVQDIYQPWCAQFMLRTLAQPDSPREEQVAKALLVAFLEALRTQNPRDEFRGFDCAIDWSSFFDVLAEIKTSRTLSPELLAFVKAQAEKAPYRLRQCIDSVENTDQLQRKSDLSQTIADPQRIIKTIQFDREIVDCLQGMSKMQYKPTGVVQTYGIIQETLRERFAFIQNLPDKSFEQLVPQLVQELLQLIQKDQTAVAEYFALTVLCSLSQEGLRRIMVLFLQQPRPFHQNLFRFCLSVTLRLTYLPQGYTLTQEQMERRRQKIELAASYIALYCTKLDLRFPPAKELDLLAIIDLGYKCQTLPVAAKFVVTYLQGLVRRFDLISPSSGLFLVALNYLNEKCQLLNPLDDGARQIVEQDLQQCTSQLYKEDVLSGNLVQDLAKTDGLVQRFEELVRPSSSSDSDSFEITPKRPEIGLELLDGEVVELKVPARLLSYQATAQLRELDHVSQVPYCLTLEVLHENPELMEQLRIIQLQQRWIPVLQTTFPQLINTVRDTTHLLFQRMVPGFSLADLKYREAFQICAVKVSLQLLRAHFLQPVASNIQRLLEKKFSFPQEVGSDLRQLYRKTIFAQLAIMAAEGVVHTFQNQARSQFHMMTAKSVQQTRFELQDELQEQPAETPFEDEAEDGSVYSQTQQVYDQIVALFQGLQEPSLQFQPTNTPKNQFCFPHVLLDHGYVFQCFRTPGCAAPDIQERSKLDSVRQLHLENDLRYQGQAIVSTDSQSSLSSLQQALGKILKEIASLQNQLASQAAAARRVTIWSLGPANKLRACLRHLQHVVQETYKLDKQIGLEISKTLSDWALACYPQAESVVSFKAVHEKDAKTISLQASGISGIEGHQTRSLAAQQKIKEHFLTLFPEDQRVHQTFSSPLQQLINPDTRLSRTLPLGILKALFGFYKQASFRQEQVELRKALVLSLEQQIIWYVQQDLGQGLPVDAGLGEFIGYLLQQDLLEEATVQQTILKTLQTTLQNALSQAKATVPWDQALHLIPNTLNQITNGLLEAQFGLQLNLCGPNTLAPAQCVPLTTLSGVQELIAEFYVQLYEKAAQRVPHDVLLWCTARQQAKRLQDSLQSVKSDSPGDWMRVFGELERASVQSFSCGLANALLGKYFAAFQEKAYQTKAQLARFVDRLLFWLQQQLLDQLVAGKAMNVQQLEEVGLFLTLLTKVEPELFCEVASTQVAPRCQRPVDQDSSQAQFLFDGPGIRDRRSQTLACILHRLIQFCSVMASPQVQADQKLRILEEQQNYDITHQQLQLQEPRQEQHEKFQQTALVITTRLTVCLQQQLLADQDDANRQKYALLLLQVVNQLRPQLIPVFRFSFLGLLSESTLLSCLQVESGDLFRPEFQRSHNISNDSKVFRPALFPDKDNQRQPGDAKSAAPNDEAQGIAHAFLPNPLTNKSVLPCLRSPVWESYAMVLKKAILAVNGYARQPGQQYQWRDYYQGLVKLLLILRAHCPEFLQRFRHFLQDAVPLQAASLRNLLLLPQDGKKRADDIQGMLSFQQTDVSECYYIVGAKGPAGIDAGLFNLLDHYCIENYALLLRGLRELPPIQGNIAYAHQLQEVPAAQQGFNQLALALAKHCYRQNKKAPLDHTAAYQYTCRLMQDLSQEQGYMLLTYLSALLNGPSQETYAAAALLLGVYRSAQNLRELFRRVILQDRAVNEQTHAVHQLVQNMRSLK